MAHSTEYRRILHRMGYYNYQAGLIYRHLNQEGGWDQHLRNCREYILKAVDFFQPGTITVLGSGWLLDLPLAEMLEKTGKVILVDIVHPKEVFSQAGSFSKIEIKEEDATGGLINEVWTKTPKYVFFRKMRDLPGITVPLYRPDFDPGLVISLNILTQLENLPVEYLKKRIHCGEEHVISLRQQIQKRHIEFLKGHRSVLITDTEEIQKTDDQTIVIPTLRIDIPEGLSKEEWTWDFDLKGSDYYNSKSVMKVLAMTFGK